MLYLFLTVPSSYHFLQIISELPTSDNWNFDLHWYRKIPGVIAASSFDGKIGIYNLEVSRLCFST
jgi:protein transport protein SEC31